MHVFFHRSTILAGFMMMFILVITGCGDGDSDNTTISGQANLPPNLGGAPIANTQFIVIDFEKRDPNNATGFQTIASGTTDSTGKFTALVSSTSSAAVIANGPQPGGPQQGKIVP